ncbi:MULTISPECIES: hypothetical protein [Streptomyces]|jgi:hypothetical protein|uniref:Secreted protein n=2 Tax=Streptomyces bottropensis TaxID=42235 RepID=M3FUT9_9ACTN|nr:MULTISPECIES: hypothetical protein [Streptomyces]EMF56710.1 hypothetical protein SBD_1793 [Streptomyces bottropensis ATCC 25435]MZD17133.1 hypothetical protein [Streptomyces sp. SID5476]
MRIRNVLPTALLAVSGLLAGAGATFAAGAGAESPESSGYPAYQCFKTADRDVYCSDKKVKNHAAGAAWIGICPPDVQKSLTGKPYLSDLRPKDALSCSGEETPENSDYPADQCSGYTAAEIILGFMGEGVVAEEYPELALVHVKEAVGATPRDVEVFLALASLKESGFAEEFRADVTSGDPYRVRNGLERLDTMSVTIHQAVTKGPVDQGTGSDVIIITEVALAVNQVVIKADFEEGKSGLTTEEAVAVVTKLLAGK